MSDAMSDMFDRGSPLEAASEKVREEAIQKALAAEKRGHDVGWSSGGYEALRKLFQAVKKAGLVGVDSGANEVISILERHLRQWQRTAEEKTGKPLRRVSALRITSPVKEPRTVPICQLLEAQGYPSVVVREIEEIEVVMEDAAV